MILETTAKASQQYKVMPIMISLLLPVLSACSVKQH